VTLWRLFCNENVNTRIDVSLKPLKVSFRSSNIPQELAANVNSVGELEILTNFTHGDAIPRQEQTILEESFNKKKGRAASANKTSVFNKPLDRLIYS
jgi:hypothetical protein